MRRFSAFAAFIVAAVGLPASPTGAGPIVQTVSGPAEGKAETGVESYLGLPYAAPPVGPLRWRAPQPAKRWTVKRDATRFGPACMQGSAQPWGPYSEEFLAAGPFSEDCLFLNLWKPQGHRRPLPVLVFIHGGAFSGGAGHVASYAGANLAKRGLIVVTINYRVGVLGFFSHPELSKEGPGAGNYGLLDQVAALSWVKANIARFGGDPARVTIAGESAGAASVNDLQVMPAANGLFARAISMSGASMAIETPPLSAGQTASLALAKKLGSTSLSAMRALSAEKLIEATRVVPGNGPPRLLWVPHVDGKLLPADPVRPEAPRASRVPLLTGFNAEEMIDPSVRVPADFDRVMRARYGDFAERLLRLYPHTTDAEAMESNRLAARDRYMSGLLFWASARPRSAADPIYLYRHDWPYPPVEGGRSWGAFHSSSLPYIFGTIGVGKRSFKDADYALSARWQDVITAFVHTGNPSLPGRRWPAVQAGSTQVMAFGRTMEPGPDPVPAVSSPERLAAWRDYAASGGQLGLM